MKEVVIVKTSRTPVGKIRQSLASVSAITLGAIVCKDLVSKTGIDPQEIDEIIFGNLFNYNWGNCARVISLEAGFPFPISAVTMDRQCASSLNAVAYGALLINAGLADVVLAGGVESYSQQPLMLKKAEMAYQQKMEFTELAVSTEAVGNPPMIMTAEALASKYGITREACDEFSLRSHQLAAAAWEKGYFKTQVIPVSVPQKKGAPIEFNMDECIRPDCSIAALEKLKPIMKMDGVVTAGNSSPMNDAGSAVLLMSIERARAQGLKPIARVSAFAASGCDPNLMGFGPVPATQKLFKNTGLSVRDIDLFEINEAFAAQTLPCMRELDIPLEKLNVNGGAIAIGHPNAASGTIVASRLIHEMERRDVRRGVATFCVGGGQGFSMLFER